MPTTSAYSRTTRLLSPLANPLLGRREELAAAESAGALMSDAADEAERWACELLAAALTRHKKGDILAANPSDLFSYYEREPSTDAWTGANEFH